SAIIAPQGRGEAGLRRVAGIIASWKRARSRSVVRRAVGQLRERRLAVMNEINRHVLVPPVSCPQPSREQSLTTDAKNALNHTNKANKTAALRKNSWLRKVGRALGRHLRR